MGLVQPTRNSRATSSPPSTNGLRSCLALLPVGVTWPPALLSAPVVSYTTFSPLPELPGVEGKPYFDTLQKQPLLLMAKQAVVFCGPFPGSPRPGVTRHCALWSADFPQTVFTVCDRPASPTVNTIIPSHSITVNLKFVILRKEPQNPLTKSLYISNA
jgi:hypothetical protein